MLSYLDCLFASLIHWKLYHTVVFSPDITEHIKLPPMYIYYFL